MRLQLTMCLLISMVCSACGDDAVSYSAPVAINLKAKSGDAKNGVVSDEKGITTEAGNPYGAFVASARDALGGVDPTRIELMSMTLTLGAKSKNVTQLEDVFGGPIEVLFLVDDTKNTFGAGKIMTPAGSGPLDGVIDFDWSALGPTDQSKTIDGSFKVVARGDVVAGYDKLDAEADLQVTFVFAAYR